MNPTFSSTGSIITGSENSAGLSLSINILVFKYFKCFHDLENSELKVLITLGVLKQDLKSLDNLGCFKTRSKES